MKVRLRKKRISSLALISFTDVIFLLLIFLLISSSFITHSGILVHLPRATTQANQYTDNIVLSMNREYQLFLNDDSITWEELPERLREMLRAEPEQVVVIRADQDIPLKDVVSLLDVAKRSNAQHFFIATEIGPPEMP